MNKIKNYKLVLKTLAPVFIGNGEEYKKIEYVYDNYSKSIYFMDSLKLFSGLKENNLSESFQKFILGNNPNLYKFFNDNNIRAEKYKEWALYSFRTENFSIKDNNTIKPFIKDAYNCPYIPGSSIKGAVRNGILNGILEENKTEYKSIENSVLRQKNNGNRWYLSNESNQLDTLVFHTEPLSDKIKKENAVNSVFKGLIISDSKPLSISDLTICKKIDVKEDTNENSLPLFMECIKPGVQIEFDVQIDTDVFPYDSEEILDYLYSYYTKQYNVFLRFFEKGQAADEEADVIYIGGNTGFVSKTCIYSLISDETKAINKVKEILTNRKFINRKSNSTSPNVRKCTYYSGKLYDMGLCEITFKPI